LADADKAQTQHAWKRGGCIAIFAAIVLVTLAGDLLSKHYVFASLLDDPSVSSRVEQVLYKYGEDLPPRDVLQSLRLQRSVAPGVNFTLSTNRGIIFGLKMPPWAIVIATFVTITIVVTLFARTDARARADQAALALILAGAMGNLYDRLFSQVLIPGISTPISGEVRDFIDCSGLYYPWIFNLADAYLVIGVILLARHLISRKHGKPEADPS